MIETFQRAPRLGAAILWAASRDEAMVVEHLVNTSAGGSALVRTAHSCSSSGCACSSWGSARTAALPARSTSIIWLMRWGSPRIHVNRVLRQLRERRLVTFRDGRVEFHDLKSLRDLAEFHSGYLDQSHGLGL